MNQHPFKSRPFSVVRPLESARPCLAARPGEELSERSFAAVTARP
ncbi:hypothetical protein ABZW47_30965 [Streptomyces sp. NPDC004549]